MFHNNEKVLMEVDGDKFTATFNNIIGVNEELDAYAKKFHDGNISGVDFAFKNNKIIITLSLPKAENNKPEVLNTLTEQKFREAVGKTTKCHTVNSNHTEAVFSKFKKFIADQGFVFSDAAKVEKRSFGVGSRGGNTAH